ncbi:MAG: hypothetical protein D6732_22700 [Methanobacteriota archaeon]|nr:MAG: hypothetical protein D6732_22700 [Euryarchaeota archaeon]
MKILPIVGGLSILFAPIVLSISTFGTNNSETTVFGFFYIMTRVKVLGIESESQEMIQGDWFSQNGIYNSFFGDYILFAMISLVLAVASIFIGFRFKRNQSGRIGGLTTLLSGIILLVIRFQELSSRDRSFFYRDSIFGVEFVYTEYPIAAITSILLGIFALLKD